MRNGEPLFTAVRNCIVRRGAAALTGVWLVAVLGGLYLLAEYDNTAGVAAAAGTDWPADSRLERSPSDFTLVLVVHPRCTCTHASLTELAEILARASTPVRTYVVFARPGRLAGDSAATALWGHASRLKGVSLVRDDDGREARAFGAATSGQLFLYDSAGRLLFSGGVTRSRGHAGDSAGRRDVVAILQRARAAGAPAPVFGCALSNNPGGTAATSRHDHESGHDHERALD